DDEPPCEMWAARRLFLPAAEVVKAPQHPSVSDQTFICRELFFRFSLLFAILLDVFIHRLRKLEVAIHVPAIGILGPRKNRELLLRLPLHNPLAARRVVVATL